MEETAGFRGHFIIEAPIYAPLQFRIQSLLYRINSLEKYRVNSMPIIFSEGFKIKKKVLFLVFYLFIFIVIFPI